MKDEQKLSRRERQIMEAVHRMGTATVREITEALPDPPTEDSIRAIMRILERKRRLVRQDSGSTLTYAASEAPAVAGRSALRRVVNTFFGGSLDAAVASFLADKEANLSKEELARLASLIRKARK
jgi:BlaI family transcriptional regulator, penicillinase repressor